MAVIAAPQTGQVGQPVRFSGAQSTSGVPITGYLWDFGDGSRSMGSDVDHSYDLAGSYVVLLTITDAEGRQAIARHAIAIQPSPQQPPSAVIAGPVTGKVGQSLTFDAAASQAGSAPINRYAWRFGDGGTSQGQIVNHTFNQPGVFQVVLDVVDANDQWDSASLQVTIASPTPPKAVIRAPSSARVGETLSFDGSGSSSGSSIVTYLWQFGDGGATDAVVAKYAYDAPDNYNVTLTIVDASGARDTATHALRVEAQLSSGPQAVITGPATVTAGQATSFSGKSSKSGASPIARYDWIVGGPGGRGSGSGVTFNYTFPSPGEYVVTLIVTDQAGLADADSVDVTVNGTRSGTMWLLEGSSPPITLMVGDDMATGSTGCNTYSVLYQSEGDSTAGSLDLSQVQQTGRACDPAAMSQEKQFLDQLQSVTGYAVKGDQLVLDGQLGRLTFTAR